MEEDALALQINESPSPHDVQTPKSKKSRLLGYAEEAFIYVVGIPSVLLYAGLAWLFCNIDVTSEDNIVKQQGNKTIFEKVQDVQEKAKKLGMLPHVIQCRVVIIMSWWLIVNLTVPGLRNKFILGSKLWKWTVLATIVLCGYHLISLLTGSLIGLLCKITFFKRNKNWTYYVNGMRKSVNLVAQSALILLSWVSYFRTSHGIKKTDDTDTVLHVLTWSFVTFAVTAVLWMLKSALLLKWEADAVYKRFHERILLARLQVYLPFHIAESKSGVFQPKFDEDEDEDEDEDQDQDEASNTSRKHTHDTVKKKAIRFLNLNDDATLYEIQEMAKFFIDLFKVSSREDDGTSHVLKQCMKINENNLPTKIFTLDELADVLCDSNYQDKESVRLNLKLLFKDITTKGISYANFEKSMVKARSSCVALGHTLCDAIEVVGVLNKVMVGLLFIIAFISWLLLTNIATTKILVLTASPLLAVTFMFGDTCKKMFEGIVFSFINHPFDVGDRCVIDKIELEVRRMNILTTTFVVIGTKEEALYPNSALSTIPIINLRGEPDRSDSIELTLDSNYTKSMLDQLHNEIQRFFKQDGGMKFEESATIVVKEIGDNVKMEVQFNHVMSINEMTHSQCLKKKRRQKSFLLLHIKVLIEEINNKSESNKYLNKPFDGIAA